MTGLLEVADGGLGVTVQDRGRSGFRALGVPLSGALDPFLLAAANVLVDNEPGAAGLEMRLRGPGLKVAAGPVRLALAGEVTARVKRSGGAVLPLPPWQSQTLFPGDEVQVGAVARGLAYLAIAGGIAVPAQLGSRSTYVRARLGGIRGRPLAAGDALPCRAEAPGKDCRAAGPLAWDEGPLRVILGPQDDHFTAAAIETFLRQPYRVTRDLDRMGMRLEGSPLEHSSLGPEIVSDGVVPGAIQVPASGQPIVLLADCQTTGGYPKIATVIQADLPRLGYLGAGAEVRFRAVTREEAAAARRERQAEFARWAAAIQPFRPPGEMDEAALYAGNLVGGVVRGDEEEREP